MDTNPFANLKTYTDYSRSYAAQDRAAATTDLENQAKQLSLAGQIVGNGAVDQPSYDKARVFAQQQGIDTSFLPEQFDPNIVNRLRFAGATPTAQLSAMLQQNQMALKAGTATGDVGAYGYGNGLAGLPANSGQTMPQPQSPQANVSPQVSSSNAPQPTSNFKQALLNGGDALLTDENGGNAPSPVTAQVAPAQAQPTFSFRPQNPGETVKAYQDARNAAFNQFKLNNAPQLKKQEAAAGKEGEDLADAYKTANAINSTLPIAMKRFNDMRIASQGADYGTGTDTKAAFYSNFPGSPTAQANTYLRQQSAQAVLPELGPQLQGMKGNKFLEGLANNSSGLDMTSPPDAKIGAVNGLENNYIGQLKIANAKIRAAGGDAPSDEEIDAQVAKMKAALPNTMSSTVEAGKPTQGVAGSIPMAAAKHLKENPALRDQFDAKYGPGASKVVLGN